MVKKPKKVMKKKPSARKSKSASLTNKLKKKTPAHKGRALKVVGQKTPPKKPGRKPKVQVNPPRHKRVLDLKNISTSQVAATINRVLTKQGYVPILTGRACVAIYARGGVKVNALEFSLEAYETEEIHNIMWDIGFAPSGLRAFRSKKCPFEIIFNTMPLTIGDDFIEGSKKAQTPKGSFMMLTITDCVRQQLSMYYHFSDTRAKNEAIKLIKKNEKKIDVEKIKQWSRWEWCGEYFETVMKEVRALP